jgi:hypothetical protein
MSCHETPIVAAGDCDPCGPSVRNRWFTGKPVNANDYEIEQRYHINRRRLINQTLHGTGIVHGLDVGFHDAKLHLSPGLALDQCGREIIVCEPLCLNRADQLLTLAKGPCGLDPVKEQGHSIIRSDQNECGSDEAAKQYILSIHYAEHGINGIRVGSQCGDEQCVPNHLCETAILSLQPTDPERPPLLKLPCDCTEIADTQRAGLTGYAAGVGHPNDDRGSKDLCLCTCKTADVACCNYCRPKPLSKWRNYRVDFDAGIALAIVQIGRDNCGRAIIAGITPIIQRCALTHIQGVGWQNWHQHPDRQVGFSSFAEMFVEPGQETDASGPVNEEVQPSRRRGTKALVVKEEKRRNPDVATRFSICFSAPVQIASLHRDIISMTLVQPDGNEDVGYMLRVPITGIWYRPTSEGDPAGTTRHMGFYVSYRFWHGEIDAAGASGFERETLVEIRLDGDSLIDWAGRPIDAESIGRRLPTGNGVIGGTFLSTFRVSTQGEVIPAMNLASAN